MLNARSIQQHRKRLVSLAEAIRHKNDLYYIGSDPTRLKILLLLKGDDELCVTDLANILDVSVSAISHQVSILEQHGLVVRVKMGQMVCYKLEKNEVLEEFFRDIVS
jgi:DNA-binding transcriptional ArsR family regulator